MQSDTYSVFANELLEFILPVLRASDHSYDFSEILPYLENWDFHYSAGSTAATLFDTFLIRLTHNTLLDDIGSAAFDNFIRAGNLPERSEERRVGKECTSEGPARRRAEHRGEEGRRRRSGCGGM